MERSPFAQEGKPVPCKYCGGVVIIHIEKQEIVLLMAQIEVEEFSEKLDKSPQPYSLFYARWTWKN
jgi:hypothetical protein